MTLHELIDWLKEEQRQFQALLDEIGPARMTLPGVAAHWSMKDLLAHLNGWHPTLIAPLQAALRGEPKPPPPWPASLKTDAEINAWIEEQNRERPLSEILAETQHHFQQLLACLQALPDDTPVVEKAYEDGVYHYFQIGDERFIPGEFFHHFHDDHEADVRRWLFG
ncbi:MAG: ClbS/DfsB family four-helix bundle protein [Chloroflexota bacterium]